MHSLLQFNLLYSADPLWHVAYDDPRQALLCIFVDPLPKCVVSIINSRFTLAYHGMNYHHLLHLGWPRK